MADEVIRTGMRHVVEGMRAFLLFAGSLAAVLAAAPACAEVYKWIDENGVTHYSDQAPANSAKKLDVVKERLSLYTPSPYSVPVSYTTGDPALQNRVDSLERQLRAERQARDYFAAADARISMAAYQQCLADRRVDCDTYSGYYPPYAAPIVVAPTRHRRPPFISSPSLTGLTAGNVVGPGAVPGNFNGANAITAGNLVTFRSNAIAPQTRSARSFASR